MTKNVTLRMDEQLLMKLHHKAVDAGMSLSAWIAATLETLVPDGEEITHAKARSLARLDRGYHLGGTPLTRDELHAR